MYFPYLRGKMYELLALKELITKGLINSGYVSPIIEPIKYNSTLKSLLSTAKDFDYKINVIENPQVGEIKDYDGISKLINDNNMVKSIIVNNLTDKIDPNTELLFYSEPKKLSLTHDVISVVPDNLMFRNKIGMPKKAVVFEDRFKKKDRNADYPNKAEEFSEYHLLYKAANYFGFGDYSIIGSEYNDSGFAPYAVAIHIVYFNEENTLMVYHFVSDSNDDIYDPANKLHEALDKFHEWYKNNDIKNSTNNSNALEQLDEIYKQDRYPGLGYLKKLEIMHHLEIMNRFLQNKKD